MASVEVLSRTGADPAAAWRGWRRLMTHTHTHSGRPDHGGVVKPPENYRRLAAWAAARGIDAIGLGSPYTPREAARFAYYEGPGLKEYYAPTFDKKSVRDLDEIETMLAEANRAGAGRPFFYLDNETPKGRYGHLWWIGYACDWPAWHDNYQVFDHWMVYEQKPGDDSDEPVPYERRPYFEIAATQRAGGALGFWAHPTSWWLGDRKQFVTNVASELPVHLVADGRADGMVVMGYAAWRPEYQALWMHFLDHGFRVPGVAEMDCGLSDEKLWASDRAYVTCCTPELDASARGGPAGLPPSAPPPQRSGPADPPRQGARGLTVRRLVEAFKTGRLFATSGPFVELIVDGRPMGEAAETAADRTHKVEITALPRAGAEGLGRIELLGRGGETLWTDRGPAGGTFRLGVPGAATAGYLIARVLGATPGGAPDNQQVAVSNPVYLHPRGTGFPAPATTAVKLTIRHGSPFEGGEVRMETAGGKLLHKAQAWAGTLTETLPASGRVTLVRPGRPSRTDYLANSNPRVIALQRYLYRGRFLRDFPTAKSGAIPPQAWKVEEFREAMREVELTY
jgi:hypothetical protein